MVPAPTSTYEPETGNQDGGRAETGSSYISASRRDSKKISPANRTFLESGFSTEPTPTPICEPEPGNQDDERPETGSSNISASKRSMPEPK